MYFNGEYTWPQFQTLDNIKRLSLNEQVQHYNKYLNDLSIQRSLHEAYVNQNKFQSFQSNVGNGAGSGGLIPTTTTTTSTTTTTTTAAPTTSTTTTTTTAAATTTSTTTTTTTA